MISSNCTSQHVCESLLEWVKDWIHHVPFASYKPTLSPTRIVGQKLPWKLMCKSKDLASTTLDLIFKHIMHHRHIYIRFGDTNLQSLDTTGNFTPCCYLKSRPQNGASRQPMKRTLRMLSLPKRFPNLRMRPHAARQAETPTRVGSSEPNTLRKHMKKIRGCQSGITSTSPCTYFWCLSHWTFQLHLHL